VTSGADLIRVRDARADDMPFITNAWRATALAHAEGVRGSDPGHWHKESGRLFERLLPAAKLRVACDAVEDESTLVGFACVTADELNYVYVAGPFRKMGVVPMLLEGLDVARYMFRTEQGLRRLRPRERGWLYTPRFTL
jgi:hypothetical protein